MTHHGYPHTDTADQHPHPTGSGAEPGQSPTRHRGHHLHMLLMCLPLVALGLWSLTRGAGGGTLIVGLACMGMMLFMHRMPGSRHRH